MKTGNVVTTPPVSDGCLNGIMRKQILDILIALKNKLCEIKASLYSFLIKCSKLSNAFNCLSKSI